MALANDGRLNEKSENFIKDAAEIERQRYENRIEASNLI